MHPPPAGASLQLVPNSKFRIHNSLCRPHSHPSHYSHSSHNCPCSSHPIIPIAPTIAPHKQHNCSIFPLLKGGQGGMLLYFHPRPTIQNSKFTIHNLPIPLALFRAHYRLEKRFSLWCIKKNSRAILLYYIDC